MAPLCQNVAFWFCFLFGCGATSHYLFTSLGMFRTPFAILFQPVDGQNTAVRDRRNKNPPNTHHVRNTFHASRADEPGGNPVCVCAFFAPACLLSSPCFRCQVSNRSFAVFCGHSKTTGTTFNSTPTPTRMGSTGLKQVFGGFGECFRQRWLWGCYISLSLLVGHR